MWPSPSLPTRRRVIPSLGNVGRWRRSGKAWGNVSTQQSSKWLNLHISTWRWEEELEWPSYKYISKLLVFFYVFLCFSGGFGGFLLPERSPAEDKLLLLANDFLKTANKAYEAISVGKMTGPGKTFRWGPLYLVLLKVFFFVFWAFLEGLLGIHCDLGFWNLVFFF